MGGVSAACFFMCLAARFSLAVCMAGFLASLVLCLDLLMAMLLDTGSHGVASQLTASIEPGWREGGGHGVVVWLSRRAAVETDGGLIVSGGRVQGVVQQGAVS